MNVSNSALGRFLFKATATLLSGCGLGGSSFTWDEDVLLNDGSGIRVSRTTRYSKTLLPAGGPAFGVLASAAVQLTMSDSLRASPWKMRLFPIHVDRDPSSGQWVVIADFYGVDGNGGAVCDFWVQYGRSLTPEVAFALEEGNWIQVPVPESFVGKRVNLFPGIPREDIPAVTLDKKAEWFSSLGFKWATIRSDLQLSIGKNLPQQCESYLRATGRL